MKKCDGCQEVFEELENWGIFNLCKACAKRYAGLKTKKKIPDIQVETAIRSDGADGTYNHRTGVIKFLKFSSEKRLFEVINHEYLHYLLGRFVSVRTSFQYDNVSLYGEFNNIS